jgi:hypothetical protein
LLLEQVEARRFRDADWELGDMFPDLPPNAARADPALHGIDPDDCPAGPDAAGLGKARRTLADLTGRSE